MADRELSLPGARLRFRDSGCGPALVLLHGWTLDLEMWAPQVRALHDAFRLIRYDRRGFGLSSGQPSLEHDIRDLTALCDHLRLTSFAVLGMSQGARVAAQAAARMPGRVSCVIFDGPPRGLLQAAGPGHPGRPATPDRRAAAQGPAHESDHGMSSGPSVPAGDDPRPDTTALASGALEEDVPIAAYRALVRTHGVSAFRNHWRQHPLVRLRTRHEPTRRLLREMLDRYPAADLGAAGLQATHLAPAPSLSTSPQAVSSIAAPALVITGVFDLDSRIRAADELARALPHGERARIPDAGHLANLDNPAYYNALLRRFLGEFAVTAPRGDPAAQVRG